MSVEERTRAQEEIWRQEGSIEPVEPLIIDPNLKRL